MICFSNKPSSEKIFYQNNVHYASRDARCSRRSLLHNKNQYGFGPQNADIKGNGRMFAVMKTGGKQYKVTNGDILRIEKVTGNAGDKVQFNEILMLGGDKVTIGTPMVSGAAVQAEILEQGKGVKLIHYVKRRRKHSSQRRKGHRQQITVLRVTDILTTGGDKTGVAVAENGKGFVPSVVDTKEAKKMTTKKPVAKKAAPKKAAVKKTDDK